MAKLKKEILDKQLEKLNLFRYKNRHELYKLLKDKIKESNMNNSDEESNTDGIDESNQKDKSKPWIKREDLNTDALKLLNSYHAYKTHFKAAKEVAANKRKTNGNVDSEENNNNIVDSFYFLFLFNEILSYEKINKKLRKQNIIFI